MKKTPQYLLQKKNAGTPITMLTAYDYPTARFEDGAGIDCILVGDSVGTNVLGYVSEREVTMDDMVHHVRAVARGVVGAYLLADMPFRSADDRGGALDNARRLIDAGADGVKLEGWGEKRAIVEHLVSSGIAVCGHIGYNPQLHGSRAQTFGKEADQALELVRGAVALEQGGASMLVIEKVRDEVAGLITERLSIPTIGIGSGLMCDGQVLVINDILGTDPRGFRHAKAYARLAELVPQAIEAYKAEVEGKVFPGEQHAWHMPSQELEVLRKRLEPGS